jgi:hypothetical protein
MSVYFVEEHNVYAPTMRYNVDEEPSIGDLKIFQWRVWRNHPDYSNLSAQALPWRKPYT